MPEETEDQQTQPGAEAPQADIPPPPAGAAQPEVGVTVEEAGTLRKKVTVTVPRQRIDAKYDEMFGELASSAQVPGFRIGHAPRRLIEKRFGKEVSQDVRNAVIGESLGEAMEKSALKTLGEPELDLEAIELPAEGDLSFSFQVEVAPEFDLPELKGIEITRPALEVTDQAVEEYIQQLRQGRATHELSDGPAAPGDIVTAGATITGPDISPLERPGLTLRVAPGQIEGLPLVDLGEKLTGARPGQTVSLTVRVPDAHPNETWRGKELQVAVAVSQVRRTVLPEADAAFAEAVGFASLEELRLYLAERLKARLADQTRRSMRDQIVRHLLDRTQFDLPEGVTQRQAGRALARQYVELLSAGVPREKIEEHLTRLQADAAEKARTSLKASFILAKIAEQRDVQVAADEVNSRIAQMAAQYNRRPERLRQELQREGQLAEVEAALREEKVLDLLLEEANITQAPAATAEPAEAEPEARADRKTPAEAEGQAPAEAKDEDQAPAKPKARKRSARAKRDKPQE